MNNLIFILTLFVTQNLYGQGGTVHYDSELFEKTVLNNCIQDTGDTVNCKLITTVMVRCTSQLIASKDLVGFPMNGRPISLMHGDPDTYTKYLTCIRREVKVELAKEGVPGG